MIIKGEAQRERDGMTIFAGMRARKFDGSGKWVGVCMGRSSVNVCDCRRANDGVRQMYYSIGRRVEQGYTVVFLSC